MAPADVTELSKATSAVASKDPEAVDKNAAGADVEAPAAKLDVKPVRYALAGTLACVEPTSTHFVLVAEFVNQMHHRYSVHPLKRSPASGPELYETWATSS